MKILIVLLSFVTTAALFAHLEHEASWGHPPEGMDTPGAGHGEIAVAENGEIYVSVTGGEKAGVQVYSPEGAYLRNVPNAPHDFHGFVIRKEDGVEYIYGVGMASEIVSKMTLAGKIVLTIPKGTVPDKYKAPPNNKNPDAPRVFKFTAVDVASNGDIYVVDGYGNDYIHQFDRDGVYLKSFGGRGKEPYLFKNLHKISIDHRFKPERILCCDRVNLRLVHLALDGEVIGEVAKGLLRPSALDFYKGHVAVAEIGGAVSILDKEGRVVKVLGTPRSESDGFKPYALPPEEWEPGRVGTPHGISFDSKGNIYVTEWNKYGRLHRFDAPLKKAKRKKR